jgi:hypothetical protein
MPKHPAEELAIESTSDSDIPQSGETSHAPRTSGWAIASLAASLGILCPVLTVAGVLLGVRALVEIKAHPLRRGRGMALAGLWIGVAASIAWVVLIFWWNANVRVLLKRGPEQALRAAYAGDLAAFREQFIGPACGVSDQEIHAFIHTLRQRHGAFIESAQDDMVSPPRQTGERSVTIPMRYVFESGSARGEVQVLLFARGLAAKLQSITIKDEHGVLAFPQTQTPP